MTLHNLIEPRSLIDLFRAYPPEGFTTLGLDSGAPAFSTPFDLLTTAKTAIIDPAWQSFSVEVYIFVALIYFAFCFAMSRYSRGLEAQERGQ